MLFRSLARYIKQEQNLTIKTDSIISALRRYKNHEAKDIFRNLEYTFKTTTISTKSGLVNISIKKLPQNQEKVSIIYPHINFSQGDVMRVSQGDYCIKLLIDKKNIAEVEKLFSKNDILHIDENLAEMNFHFPKSAGKKAGIIGIITNELAIYGIAVIEIISCNPEVQIYIDEKNLSEAHQVIYKLCHDHN